MEITVLSLLRVFGPRGLLAPLLLLMNLPFKIECRLKGHARARAHTPLDVCVMY